MLDLGQNQMIAAIIAAFLPLLISLLKKSGWSHFYKVIASLVISVVVALVVSIFGNNIYWKDLIYNIPIVVAIAQATYTVIWENLTPIEEKIEGAIIDKIM